MKQQIWLAQDKHLLFHQHTLPVFLARKKETNTGIYSIFFPEKRGPDRQSCSFFLFILLLCSFHSSLAMIIAPGKTLLAQWWAYSCSEVAILLFKLFGSLVLVSLKISTVWHQPLTAGCACESDQQVGIASGLVWSTFLKLQHLSLLNASLSSKLFRHFMANFH